MRVKCAYKKCGGRRIHNENPEVTRKHQTIEVPEGFKGRAYCSIECMAYAGDLKTKKEANASA